MAANVQLRAGDVVLVNRVETFFAVVQHVTGRRVSIAPCDPRIRDTLVRLDEIVTVYRAIGTPAPRARRLRPSPKQLRLDEG